MTGGNQRLRNSGYKKGQHISIAPLEIRPVILLPEFGMLACHIHWQARTNNKTFVLSCQALCLLKRVKFTSRNPEL